MSVLARHIKWVMLLSGAMTCIALALAQGQLFLSYQAGQAVVIDTVMIMLFAAYLIRRRAAAPKPRPDHLST